MEKEKESKEEIVVFDEGIDLEAMASPDFLCCIGAFTPLRS